MYQFLWDRPLAHLDWSHALGPGPGESRTWLKTSTKNCTNIQLQNNRVSGSYKPPILPKGLVASLTSIHATPNLSRGVSPLTSSCCSVFIYIMLMSILLKLKQIFHAIVKFPCKQSCKQDPPLFVRSLNFMHEAIIQ